VDRGRAAAAAATLLPTGEVVAAPHHDRAHAFLVEFGPDSRTRWESLHAKISAQLFNPKDTFDFWRERFWSWRAGVEDQKMANKFRLALRAACFCDLAVSSGRASDTAAWSSSLSNPAASLLAPTPTAPETWSLASAY
jgi:hypothetical protein